jgi:hypothetical protein
MKLESTHDDASLLKIRSVANAALDPDTASESLCQNRMAKMKASLIILLVALLLNAVSTQRVEAGVILESVVVSMVDDATLVSKPYEKPQVTVSATSSKKGILEESEMAIGTILNSYHFSSYDFNETHGGLYISMNQWTVGTFLNSIDEQSVMVTYNSNLYKKESFKVDLVAGLANGYERMEYDLNGYLPILGVSAQWKYLKTVLMPNAVAIGIELPLN